VARYHPRALRWFLVNTQYRQPINYTQRALEEVRRLEKILRWCLVAVWLQEALAAGCVGDTAVGIEAAISDGLV